MLSYEHEFKVWRDVKLPAGKILIPGVVSRATQLEVDLSNFPSVAAHFKRMQERPSVKKLLAYEKEVNEGFAKTA